tara:strand:+ start:95 stop:223 length:129 start_codon:yes stop_codon:yes gene_type:complete
MKIKAIVFQNNPKKIHGHINKINLFGLQHDYIFEDSKEKKVK